MSTLLIRLAGPLQAWGTDSKFNKRMTGREPTKSGVVGLVAAALGLRRTDDAAKLCKLRFGVRVDQPGKLVVDFHTARRHDGKSDITHRYYIADAVFLAGLEGEEPLLKEIDAALKTPWFPLFLGRRACPPVGQLSLGVRDGAALMEALRDEPWQAAGWYKAKTERAEMEIVRDAVPEDNYAFTVRDQPLSFDQVHRRYTFRPVVSDINAVKIINLAQKPDLPETPTSHDAMAEVP
ncbi:MAG: type I-E CRISPR-associated protein Cas5/CasD [Acidaminococcales bacterium]|nr:type I-E CRISPR-associated protein Cas5/CasD [Acidaminococcales bacterium]